jgi:hypothetical protein
MDDAAPSTTVVDVTGPEGTFRIGLGTALYVGRECGDAPPEQRLIIDHPSVSRLHVELHLDAPAGRVHAIDRSRNGTLLNGTEMPGGTPIVLFDGDSLVVGPTTLRLRLDATATVPRVPKPPEGAAKGDITGVAVRPVVTAVASTTAQAPPELTERLSSAARLFGGVPERLAGALVMVRWNDATGERECARFVDFATLLANSHAVPIEWSFLRG